MALRLSLVVVVVVVVSEPLPIVVVLLLLVGSYSYSEESRLVTVGLKLEGLVGLVGLGLGSGFSGVGARVRGLELGGSS